MPVRDASARSWPAPAGSREQSPATPEAGELVVIGPRSVGPVARLRELWRYRHLLPFFGRRFLEKRYLRTWLGWWWLPLRPVLDTVIAVFVFGTVLEVSTGEVPYLLFFLVGMTAWQIFEQTAFWATRSLELNRSLLRRIYVPRLLLLLGSMSIGLVDFVVFSLFAALAVGWFAISDGVVYLQLSPSLLVAVGGLILLAALALALALWLSILGAQARDVRFGLRYALGFWMFVTPVFYPLSTVPDDYRSLIELNPVVAPIEMVRSGLLGVGNVPLLSIVSMAVVLVVVAGGGLWFFGRAEEAAADAA